MENFKKGFPVENKGGDLTSILFLFLEHLLKNKNKNKKLVIESSSSL